MGGVGQSGGVKIMGYEPRFDLDLQYGKQGELQIEEFLKWIATGNGRVEIKRYWDLREEAAPTASDEENVAAFRTLFLESVRLRPRGKLTRKRTNLNWYLL